MTDIGSVLRYHAQQHPDRLAFTFLKNGEQEEAQWTFNILDRYARAIAAQLQLRGLAGTRVLLSYPPGIEFITGFLGCLYAGAIAVPVTPPKRNQHGSRLATIALDARASALLTCTSLANELTAHCRSYPALQALPLLISDDHHDQAAHWADQWNAPQLDGDDIAFLQYTSGSTGAPKGVVISHRNILHNEAMVQRAFGHDANTVFVGWLPLYHDMGLIGNVLQPIFLGIHCVLMSPVAFTQKPIRWLRAISHYRATTSGAPNFAYDLCAQRITPEQCEGLDLSSWQVAYNGAEPVRAATLTRFSERFRPFGFQAHAFYPCYGMAEATLFIAGQPAGQQPTVMTVDALALAANRVQPVAATHDSSTRDLVGCGHSWQGQQLHIVDPNTTKACSEGQIGEIWVSGDSVAHGYWNNESATLEAFAARIDGLDEGPFLRTGDLGFMWNGALFVTGRLKDIIIVAGRNHYPQDIEATVATSHVAFRDGGTAAFTVDSDSDPQLVIVQEIERSALRQLDSDECAQLIKQIVAAEHGLKVHDVVLIAPSTIPKTTSNKIRRQTCRTHYLAGELRLATDALHREPELTV